MGNASCVGSTEKYPVNDQSQEAENIKQDFKWRLVAAKLADLAKFEQEHLDVLREEVCDDCDTVPRQTLEDYGIDEERLRKIMNGLKQFGIVYKKDFKLIKRSSAQVVVTCNEEYLFMAFSTNGAINPETIHDHKKLVSFDTSSAQVHEDIKEKYEMLEDDLREYVQTQLKTKKNIREILITGHGVGGGVATLCAFDFAQEPLEGCEASFRVITFGAPAIGDKKFKEMFDNTTDKRKRVVTESDNRKLKIQPKNAALAHVGTLCVIRDITDSTSQGYIKALEESKKSEVKKLLASQGHDYKGTKKAIKEEMKKTEVVKPRQSDKTNHNLDETVKSEVVVI